MLSAEPGGGRRGRVVWVYSWEGRGSNEAAHGEWHGGGWVGRFWCRARWLRVGRAKEEDGAPIRRFFKRALAGPRPICFLCFLVFYRFFFRFSFLIILVIFSFTKLRENIVFEVYKKFI